MKDVKGLLASGAFRHVEKAEQLHEAAHTELQVRAWGEQPRQCSGEEWTLPSE